MTTQPEAILEHNFIQQLMRQGYKLVTIRDKEALVSNLKKQLGTFKKGLLQQMFV